MNFTREEYTRYSRHFVLPTFGIRAQARLKSAKVLIIGAGGLGCPVIQYLSAAGVGTMGIVDNDIVSLSNLQRQILYKESDIGKSKVACAATYVQEQNVNVQVIEHALWLNAENALELISNYQLVIDCTDNFPTRYLINDACVILDKPFIYGSIFRFEGQVAVFNLKNNGENSPTYRDIFPEPPAPESVPNCEEGGVLGVLPGIIGSIQANEAIKVLAKIGKPLVGRLLIFDAWALESRVVKIRRNDSLEPIEKLIDYDAYCGIKKSKEIDMNPGVNEITVEELKSMKDANEDFQLIDVREPYEYEIANLGGTLIPLGTIMDAVDQIDKEKKVVVHCRSGARSSNAIQFLQENFNYTNLVNLQGGILAYADRIDNSLTKY